MERLIYVKDYVLLFFPWISGVRFVVSYVSNPLEKKIVTNAKSCDQQRHGLACSQSFLSVSSIFMTTNTTNAKAVQLLRNYTSPLCKGTRIKKYRVWVSYLYSADDTVQCNICAHWSPVRGCRDLATEWPVYVHKENAVYEMPRRAGLYIFWYFDCVCLHYPAWIYS